MIGPHFAVQLAPQRTTWRDLRDCALRVEQLGFDSLWSWDHLVPRSGGSGGTVLAAWEVVAAWGAVTHRIRLGVLVSSNTFRHPALLAKMAITLDHISDGRAILGLGAGWYEAEHNAYGLSFGSAGDRLSRLAEAAALIRMLLHQERTTFTGRHYRVTDVAANPHPVQERLPLLIGGGGERKTLRIVARSADYWHAFGTPELMQKKLAVLHAYCAEIGRDPLEIIPFASVYPLPVIRETDKSMRAWLHAVAAANGLDALPQQVEGTEFLQLGNESTRRARTPEEVVELLLSYWRAGIRGFVFVMLAPYDLETLASLARDVRPSFERSLATLRLI